MATPDQVTPEVMRQLTEALYRADDMLAAICGEGTEDLADDTDVIVSVGKRSQSYHELSEFRELKIIIEGVIASGKSQGSHQ